MTAATQCIERYEVIVVGGGQAGLAVAYHLVQKDHDVLVLDASARVGDCWRGRWDSLRLFTPARYSLLPGMPIPAPAYHLPTKDEMADYLEAYVAEFDLPVRGSTKITRLRREGDVFILEARDRTYEAENVVIATGGFGTPHIPAFAQSLAPPTVQIHSSTYRNPAQLPDGDALVVGAGNSGAQIAIELSESRRVWLSGPDVGHIPRRLLGRDVYDWMWPVMRTRVDTWLGRRIKQKKLLAGDSLIGMGREALDRATLERVGRTTGVQDGKPLLDDGRALDVRSIVWCTGYRPDFRWVDLPIFGSDGYPIHERGTIAQAPGLYFMGLRFMTRLNSALIGGVGEDAARVAAEIARRAMAQAA